MSLRLLPTTTLAVMPYGPYVMEMIISPRLIGDSMFEEINLNELDPFYSMIDGKTQPFFESSSSDT